VAGPVQAPRRDRAQVRLRVGQSSRPAPRPFDGQPRRVSVEAHDLPPAARQIAVKKLRHLPIRITITAYLKNGRHARKAAAMANHASTRTTQLYDRRHDEVSLDEVERIVI
jgi:hypothetical protein